MTALFRTSDPLPGDPSGKRLCEIFGRYLWQFIQAELPQDATQKPKWRVQGGYPLRLRVLWAQWQDAAQLVGVRFGQTTSYALIDIDAGSCYHTPDAIADLRAALETIGISRTLLLQSSWNGGLHLYIPLPSEVNTFSLAVALKECCKAQGFQLKSGTLEILPNTKAFGVSIFVEYQPHRLPLQPGSGSFLLDDALQPVTDNLARFLQIWDGAAQSQDMELLHQALIAGRNAHRKRPKRQKLSAVDAWRTDLEIEISEGWTSYAQTNALLKSIACYGRVFERLAGKELAEYVERIAVSRPGYQQYCRHQHEIRRRAIAWARAVENYYWPLGSEPKRRREEQTGPNGNELRSQDAQRRIQDAVEQLTALGQFPQTVSERINALVELAQTSKQTLYKHRSLWHPDYFLVEQPVIDQIASVSADQLEEIEKTPVLSNLRKMKELHTLEGIMKSRPQFFNDVGSDLTFISPDRGVRGDELSFPQPIQPSFQLPIPFPLPIPLAEVHNGLRQQVQRLGWNGNQVAQFIAQKFGGRRRSELQDNDLVTLLYHLQTANIKLFPGSTV